MIANGYILNITSKGQIERKYLEIDGTEQKDNVYPVNEGYSLATSMFLHNLTPLNQLGIK